MMPFSVARGNSPVILAMPHGGTHIPPAIARRFNENGHKLTDTDWHIQQLYEGLLPDATVVSATFHRSVIDANRDPSGHSLYPGQNTTSLCPVTDFDGSPIWREGQEPGPASVKERLRDFHAPYHAALHAEVNRVKSEHGVALVYDCHSIRSRIPFLFDGELPTLNIGTDNGTTCAATLERRTVEICAASPFPSILNGRFRGGWTTRHYGKPATGVHAIQMEIAQSAYLETESPPWNYHKAKAAPLRKALRQLLEALRDEILTLSKDTRP